MPAWLKIVLGVAALGALLCAGSVGAMVWWAKSNEEKLKELSGRVTAEGRSFGQGHDAQACVTEALHRQKRESGIIAEAGVSLFLKECLKVAPKPPGFCEGVPPRSELLATVQWAIDACEARGLAGDQPCTRLIKAMQEACAP